MFVGGWPFCDAGDLDGIHLDLVVRDDHAEIFDTGFFEFALLMPEVQVVLAHAIEDNSSDPAMFFEAVCEDEDVVEVNGDNVPVMRSLKISFIIAWKVAGEFISPKYITRGSKRPRFVRNTAFHSSPSFIRMLL